MKFSADEITVALLLFGFIFGCLFCGLISAHKQRKTEIICEEYQQTEFEKVAKFALREQRMKSFEYETQLGEVQTVKRK